MSEANVETKVSKENDICIMIKNKQVQGYFCHWNWEDIHEDHRMPDHYGFIDCMNGKGCYLDITKFPMLLEIFREKELFVRARGKFIEDIPLIIAYEMEISEDNKEFSSLIPREYTDIDENIPFQKDLWHADFSLMHNLLSRDYQKIEAIKFLSLAIEKEPGCDVAWRKIGELFEQLNKQEEALKYYEKYLELKPDDEWIMLKVAELSFFSNKSKESLKILNTLIQKNPDNYWTWHLLSHAYRTMGKYERSIEAAIKALDIEPNLYDAVMEKGISLSKLGRYEEAFTCFDEMEKLISESDVIWLCRGDVYSEMGEYKKASECYKKAQELDDWEFLRKKLKELKSL